jgi:hypothetical protein
VDSVGDDEVEVIAHFYHVYSGGQWLQPVEEHCDALLQHGLYQQLDAMYVGLVGPEGESRRAVGYMRRRGLDPVVVTRSWEGWEQETLRHVQPWARQADGICLYAHTKSAHDPSDINVDWRKSMCFYNVVRWQPAIEGLGSEFDTAGCHWLGDMYGGNYWWATAAYLRTLPPLEYESRWHAEGWISKGEGNRVKDLNPGHPGSRRFVLSW